MKTAVILFNLGGPDKKESIKPFLKNFFMDKAIIPAPRPFRDLISTLIANKRSRKEAGDSYKALGDKSPLLDNTYAQAHALQESLGAEYRTFVCMRYWHPMAPEVVKAVKDFAPDRIILVPLYPQFSTTTTGSSYEDWMRACKKQGLDIPQTMACCYPLNEGFIKASADNIRKEYEKMDPKPRLLFSAHGVPLFVLKRGDPYQWQCSATVKAIVKELNIEGLDYAECYQSRVGPVKWTEPSVEHELERAAADKVSVLIYPHAFVSEHVETLVEIEEEYREMAHEMGIHGFARVPTVSTHPAFIEGLKVLVLNTLSNSRHSCESRNLNDKKDPSLRWDDVSKIHGAGKNGTGLCPPEFKACACRQYCT